MSVSLEQIEMLRARANVTYGEAKEVLEKCDGDVLAALIDLENQAKIKPPKMEEAEGQCWQKSKGFMKGIKNLIKKCNRTKFVVSKADRTVLDFPLTLMIIITVAMTPLTVAGILVALLTNHKLSFLRSDGGDLQINKTMDKISSCVNSVGNQVAEAMKD